jgi:hypothetical protein
LPEDDAVNPKPRNLKPLRRSSKSKDEPRSKSSRPFRNLAEEYLSKKEKEKNEGNVETAKEMQKLNDDMDEYL